MASKKKTLPTTLDLWLDEILRAWNEAVHAKPFGLQVGAILSESELFRIAPLVCLKFRGREQTGPEAERTRDATLARYLVKSDPRSPAHTAVSGHPKMAFALCYMTAHLVMSLVDEQTAGQVMAYCEERLVG